MSSWLTARGIPGGTGDNTFDEAYRDDEFSSAEMYNKKKILF